MKRILTEQPYIPAAAAITISTIITERYHSAMYVGIIVWFIWNLASYNRRRLEEIYREVKKLTS